VFYEKLNALLNEAGFDRWIEELCQPYYHRQQGRPGIPPGVYFRMLLVGYFEGIGSQRGIAWRCADSLSLRRFLGVPLSESTPDHSSLTRVRDRLPLEVHESVFRFVLSVAIEKGLLHGKTVAVDSTTLEANAAMKSIVRRDTHEDWNDYLRRLMQAEGCENPTDEDLRRFDQKRKDKKVSNEDWVSPTDHDSRIAKMKDGRTHLAYKAENVIDIETELVLGASICHADEGDVHTLVDSVIEAQVNLKEAGSDTEIEEVVADKGYHSTETITLSEDLNLRTYIPERRSPRKRNWRKTAQAKRQAVLRNRRRTRGARSKRLQRMRSERAERSFAHMCDSGGARRTWLRGLEKVQKRYLVSAMARNLGLVMRTLYGIGTPKAFQLGGGFFALVYLTLINIGALISRIRSISIVACQKSRCVSLASHIVACAG
jgi:transposase